jgi:hypothetical protein
MIRSIYLRPNVPRQWGDVFSLQRILGHSPSSRQVTRRYVDLLDDDLRAVHRDASPIDRLG